MGDTAEPHDSRLAHAFFRGVAKVPIEALKFDHDIFVQHHRPVSEKIVQRLRSIFRREGCLRDDSGNWIDALVDASHLEAVLSKNGLCEADLRPDAEKLPLLELNRVDCLQGVHRILAASRLLNPNDRWWTVRLYSKDLPKDACIKIIECSANEQPYSDGEIFRKIRLYHRKNDKSSEQKWWARLTKTKQKDVQQLLKNHSDLTHAFDSLIDMPGLWYPVQLGTLHRLLTLRCNEELLHYLSRICNVWKKILGAAKVSPEVVDRDTVEKLEHLAPSASIRDRELIERMFVLNDVFREVTDRTARATLLSTIISLPGLIPSLRSFFENLKYLEPCSAILRKLIPTKGSIFQSLAGAYFAPSEQIVECAEHRRRKRSKQGYDKDIWLSYVQLWAFCMRHFPAMTQLLPRKELGKEKPSSYSNTALWHYLGSLAVSLGFRTEQALRFQSQDPHEILAEQLLRSAHPESSPDARLVTDVASILRQAETAPESVGSPQLTREDFLPVERRCGRPFEDDFLEDKDFLFIPYLYECEPSVGRDITPFFVKRDTFLSFFGNKYERGDEGARTDDDDDDDDYYSTAESAAPSPRPSSDEDSASKILELDQALQREKLQTDQLQGKTTQLEMEVDGLRKELNEQEMNALDLERKIEELQAEHDALRSSSRTTEFEEERLHQEGSQLRGKMEALQDKLDSVVQELEASQTRLAEKGKKLEHAETQLNEKEKELENARTKLREDERELEDAKAKLRENEKEIEDARAELSQKEIDVKERDEEIEKKGNEMKQKDEEIEKKDNEMKQKDGEIEKRDEEIKKRDEEIEKLNIANENLVAAQDSRTTFHREHPVEYGGLDADLEKAKKKVSELQKELEDAHIQASNAAKDAKESVDASKKALKEAEEESRKLKKARDEALKATSRVETLLEETKEKAHGLQQELDEAQREIDTLKKDLKESKKGNDQCNKDLEEAKATIAGQKRRLDELDGIVSRNGEETAEREKQTKDLNHRVQALEGLFGDKTDALKDITPVEKAIWNLFALAQEQKKPKPTTAPDDFIAVCPGNGMFYIRIPTEGGEAIVERVLQIIWQVNNHFTFEVNGRTTPRANWNTVYIRTTLFWHGHCIFWLKDQRFEEDSDRSRKHRVRDPDPNFRGHMINLDERGILRAWVTGVEGKRQRMRGESAHREEQTNATSSTSNQEGDANMQDG